MIPFRNIHHYNISPAPHTCTCYDQSFCNQMPINICVYKQIPALIGGYLWENKFLFKISTLVTVVLKCTVIIAYKLDVCVISVPMPFMSSTAAYRSKCGVTYLKQHYLIAWMLKMKYTQYDTEDLWKNGKCLRVLLLFVDIYMYLFCINM